MKCRNTVSGSGTHLLESARRMGEAGTCSSGRLTFLVSRTV